MSSCEHGLYATWVTAKELNISPTQCLFQLVVRINSDDCPERPWQNYIQNQFHFNLSTNECTYNFT